VFARAATKKYYAKYKAQEIAGLISALAPIFGNNYKYY
jgi:hypothetical protein